jgi:hypothetical protein
MVSGCDRPPRHGLGAVLQMLLPVQGNPPFLHHHSEVLLGIHDDQRAWIGKNDVAVVVGDGNGERGPRSGKYIQMRQWGALCPLGTTEHSHWKEILHGGGYSRGKGSGRSVQPRRKKDGDDGAHESMATLVGYQSDIWPEDGRRDVLEGRGGSKGSHRSMMGGWSCSIRKGGALMDHKLHGNVPLPQNHRSDDEDAKVKDPEHGRNEARMVACGQ